MHLNNIIEFNKSIEADTEEQIPEETPRRRPRRAKKKRKFYIDYNIIIAVVFLLLFGLMMVYSATSYKHGNFYLKRQLIATAIGALVCFFAAFFPYNWWEKMTLPIYIASVGVIFLVLTKLGVTAGNATRWIKIYGGFNLQPAEITKIGVILILAALIKKMGERINTWLAFLIIMGLVAAPAVIIKKVTDNLSTAIIVCVIGFGMYFIACSSKKILATVFGAGVLGGAGVAYYVYRKITDPNPTKSMRITRIMAWLHPEDYSDKTSYQTLQALYAIGSGGIGGKGLGEGIQKLENIPEAHNDMIFSVVCEELGLFGAFAIMLLFLYLIIRCMIIAMNTKEMFGKMIASGIMIHFATQVILNIAVVTNTIPNTGISLPFISYGGSSLLFLMAEIGLVLSVGMGERTVPWRLKEIESEKVTEKRHEE